MDLMGGFQHRAGLKEFEQTAFTLTLAITCPRMHVINMSHLKFRVGPNLILKINSASRHPLPTEHHHMNLSRLSLSTIVASALLTLSACGGGSNPENYVDSFITKINQGLTALGTSSGLTSKSVADVFDNKYLDMGFTKANLLDALTANSAALVTNPDLSLFPMVQFTNLKFSECNSNNICTLNATLINSDADTTSVDFSAKVIFVSGVFYLYGDQSSTPSI
jgi:hypothetical protein